MEITMGQITQLKNLAKIIYEIEIEYSNKHAQSHEIRKWISSVIAALKMYEICETDKMHNDCLKWLKCMTIMELMK